MSDNLFCSECGKKLYPFEQQSSNHYLDGDYCGGCALNKQRHKMFHKAEP